MTSTVNNSTGRKLTNTASNKKMFTKTLNVHSGPKSHVPKNLPKQSEKTQRAEKAGVFLKLRVSVAAREVRFDTVKQ